MIVYYDVTIQTNSVLVLEYDFINHLFTLSQVKSYQHYFTTLPQSFLVAHLLTFSTPLEIPFTKRQFSRHRS